MASHFGNLMMERVIKDENGQQKPGSLVFRIKRALPKTNDNPEIKCSSPLTNEISSEEERKNLRSPIPKVRIPKALVLNNDSGIEMDINECRIPDDLSISNECEDSDLLIDTTAMNNNITNINSEVEISSMYCKKSQDNVLTESVSVKTDPIDDTLTSINSAVKIPSNFLKQSQHNISIDATAVKTEPMNDNVTNLVPEVEIPTKCNKEIRDSIVIDTAAIKTESLDDNGTNITSEVEKSSKRRRRSRRDISKAEIPIELRRRSRRIVDLQFQNKCHQAPATMKRRQKRKITPHVDNCCKKRKYGRRGRPPKSAVLGNNFFKPVTTKCLKPAPKKDGLEPDKNTVWTLVPKELFESEFFKSQVLQVSHASSLERKNVVTPTYFSSPVISQPLPHVINRRIQLKFPTNVVNTVPAVVQNAPEIKNVKRPTVIYFTKNFNAYTPNQLQENHMQSEFIEKVESTKVYYELLYLCSKYRTLEETVVKNFYELTRRNFIETDAVLSALVSKSPSITSFENIEHDYVKRDVPTNNFVSGLGSDGATLSYLPTSPSSEDTDTLCRSIMVESLKILFSEEAVLQ